MSEEKATVPPPPKVKDPNKVAAGKASAAKTKEKLAKLKDYEEREKHSAPPEPNDKVTAPPSQKVKNPRRVAAGKELAAKNKERAAKLKDFEESQKVTPPPHSEPAAGSSVSWTTVAGLGFVVVTAGGYLAYQKLSSRVPKVPAKKSDMRPPEVKEKKFDFDDF